MATVRQFFADNGVIEVFPPVLGATTVTDPHIQSFAVATDRAQSYLQTSPEFAMKKLLAQGSGPIFSLGSVFRAGEHGHKHRSEFMMLEWYRPEMSLVELQSEITNLINVLANDFSESFPTPDCQTYQQVFSNCYGYHPHLMSDELLKTLVEQKFSSQSEHIDSNDAGTRNDHLDLLFSLGVEPSFQEPIFITQFPVTQSALAKSGDIQDGMQTYKVALRSELYWQGVELANAYEELRDSEELKKRMILDNETRVSRGYPVIDIDESLLIAIEQMPECTGVALGIDRLLMLLMGKSDIQDVLYPV